MSSATGTFQIRMNPHAPNGASSPDLGRMHFDKDWTGDLTGHSQGEMISVGDPASGTASYVVLEVFTGTLHGQRGSFAFRQVGDMHAGQVTLVYTVVPHSGSGELEGLTGTLTLTREAGVHTYTLDATVGAADGPTSPLSAELRALFLRDLDSLERELDLYPDDASVWQAVPGQPNTAGTLILHVAGGTQHFLGAAVGGSGYVRDRAAEFARRDVPRAELRAELAAARQAVTAALTRLTDADLARPYPARLTDHDLSGRLTLLQLATHLAYHLGQVDYHRRAVTGDATSAGTLAPPSVTP
ncbi:DUF3224 family protein [Deinococcus sp. KSM4-11]|uniref:DUF3224 domain-containing protein n=1 Tax=Deinococcus sp. KSM4-11 TaxID=2568654 RepID=UPI0010A4FDFC|nr:DUF3224 domain-containing protein [Deinococcus sp. KSM4-11]THF86556.1 DUF3224 family protein [Deinococcus sp. KSM4-11]